MDNHCLIAEFNNEDDFRTALEVLEKARFTADEVSMVTHAGDESLSEIETTKERTTESPPGEKTTAASILAGGTLGAALGSMTLMGPMLVAGPILGMAAGAVGGSMLNMVERWGVEHEVADDYETKVRNGSRLVIVTGDEIRLAEAQRSLKTTGPASLEIYSN